MHTVPSINDTITTPEFNNGKEGLLSLGDLLRTADVAAGVGLMVSFVRLCVSCTYCVDYVVR